MATELVELRGRRRGPPPGQAEAPPTVQNVVVLAEDLAHAVEGEVRFDAGDRALYATDASNYRQLPIGVVVPRHIDDVLAAVAVCRRHGAPVLMRGGGTSVAGQCCNVAVVLDLSKYVTGILDLDVGAKRARVLPGTVLDDLRGAAQVRDLTFGPDPATHDHCTLGGMLGNNSCGPHGLMAGLTSDNVHELEVLTYDGLRLRVGPTSPEELAAIIAAGGRRGEIYRQLGALRDRYAGLIRQRFPKIPRRVSGYNLDQLLPENGFHVGRTLCGSEGTCATILEATVRLVDWPRARALLVLGYPDIFAAADHVPEILRHRPLALEALDARLMELIYKQGRHDDAIQFLPAADAFVLVEFGGDEPEDAVETAGRALESLGRRPGLTAEVVVRPQDQRLLWAMRESALGVTAYAPGEKVTWDGWEDAAVAPEKLGVYLRQFQALLRRYDYQPALYGHFGQGCVHCRIQFDFKRTAGIAQYRAFVQEAADLVARHGGSLSGEHGDGQSKAELLPRMFGSELVEAFRAFKRIWDPDNKMNPGKVVDSRPLDRDLRLNPHDHHPAHPPTHFQFPDDGGQMALATERCVGIGACRRMEGGTMCPSYRVLREEEHATRGRAHLLFEMLRGTTVDSPTDGWRDDKIRGSLELCLGCKGCKAECPTSVDVATYKAEFLAHHYQGRLRPRAAYTMGLVHWWARLGARVPRLANLLTQSPLFASVAKSLAGIAPDRRIPPFAARTFKQQFAAYTTPNPDGPPVILWPDTFNNHFFPETAMAAVQVIESAGFRVVVPQQPLCCGRPLYDFGMLPTAKRLLRHTMDALRQAGRDHVPIVGLEPSCLSVLRDELRGLFPDDPDAPEVRKMLFTIGEFLSRHHTAFTFPQLPRRAVVHGHCHAKALWGMSADSDVLARMGVEHEIIDSGCCGMAGSFGFEAGEKYRVSVAVGERKLLPAVREAGLPTLIIADGFSCREQIGQQTNRQALHLADVALLAARQPVAALSGGQTDTPWPESAVMRPVDDFPILPAWQPAVIGAVGLAGLLAAVGTWRRRDVGAAAALRSPVVVGALAVAALGGALLSWASRSVRMRRAR